MLVNAKPQGPTVRGNKWPVVLSLRGDIYSITPPPRLKEHHGRGGRKTVGAGGQGELEQVAFFG